MLIFNTYLAEYVCKMSHLKMYKNVLVNVSCWLNIHTRLIKKLIYMYSAHNKEAHLCIAVNRETNIVHIKMH